MALRIIKQEVWNMKVLLVNGSPNEKGCTFTALDEVARTLNAEGIDTEILWLGVEPLSACTACGACEETGVCFMDDIVNRVIAMQDELEGLIVGSPVHYAGATGQLTNFLNRLFFAGGSGLDSKFAAAVVSCRRGGASAAFGQLNKYFLMNNMPVVPSQYWNMVHGHTPDQVRQDKEGLQTMRTLARNMAWLIRIKRAGLAAGIPLPVREPWTPTNFIR